MRPRFSWRKFGISFLFVYAVLLIATMASGCSAAWLGAVGALMPALEAAVSAAVAFVMALEGKTVPASVTAAIQKIGSDVAAEIAEVQQLIAAYQAAASTGTLSQIQAVMQAIISNLTGILSAGGITDSSTVGKLTALVGLAIAAANAVIGLIPLVTSALSSSASREVLEAQDKEAAAYVDSAHKALQAAYVTIRTTATPNTDVNSALSVLPTNLP
jgi:hypothetical protein